MNNPLKIILEVLSIIDYQGDKDKMAEIFIQLVHDNAILAMIDNLEPKKKSELQRRLSKQQLDVNSPEYTKLAKEFFTEDSYKKAIQESSQKLFAKYLTEIIPTLSQEQQDKLFGYLGSLSQTQQV